MASKPYHPPPEEEPIAKKSRPEAQPPPLFVELNPSDCDLDFNIEKNGLQGHALHEKGFAYCWSGARATVGITGGKYCFGCKVISEQSVEMADTPADQQHLSRVGISRGDNSVGNLGETMHSFGFGGTGKFSNAGIFSDFGAKFGLGDTIICFVDLESRPLASIGFSKNGNSLGIAKQFDAGSRGLGVVDTLVQKRSWDTALFPHILLKNVVVQLQFSIEDGLVLEEGYKPWSSALDDGNAIIGPSFSNPKDCEVLMMVGLPASGKTTWAEKCVKDHPEKRYVLLGTNLALEQMKVPGLMRKQNYSARFDRLMDRATEIFNTLLARAAKTPRNYIIDQTNVYRNARNRKLKPFGKFRKIAIVVFPEPDELKNRADKRFKEMGKDVPAEAVNEMLVNYLLPMTKDMPGSNEFFDEVVFPELSREEAQKHLDEMKRALKSPTLYAKREFSPYYRECSVRSFSSPSIEKKEVASAAGGHWSNSQSPALFSDRDIMNPIQVSTSYSAGDLRTDYGRPVLRDDSSPYGSHNGPDPYRRSSSEMSVNPMLGMSPYHTYGAADAYKSPRFESPGPHRLDYGCYSTPVPNIHDPGFSQVNRPSGSQYEYRSPLQGAYGASHDLASYSSHGGPLDNTYGSTRDLASHGGHGGPLQGMHGTARDFASYRSHGAEFLEPRGRQPLHEWQSPPHSIYGTPYPTRIPRPPSGLGPPIARPHDGSWYR